MGIVRILFLADTHLGFDYAFRPRIKRRREAEDLAEIAKLLYEIDSNIPFTIHAFFPEYQTLRHMISSLRCEKYHQTLDKFGHKSIIQFFHGVRRRVIVRITEKSRIRYHHGLIALVPERGVITEPDRRNDPPVERNG